MLQVIAYNKIDVPDSGDYIEEVQEFLWGQGLARDDVHAISAVTGQGVLGLVRRARAVLDQLPSEVGNPGTFSLPLSLTLSYSLLLAACSVLFPQRCGISGRKVTLSLMGCLATSWQCISP